jgi:hypothetical protein
LVAETKGDSNAASVKTLAAATVITRFCWLLSAAAMPGRVSAKVIAGYAGQGSIEKDSTVWNVEYDNSAGWEVTTPVLANADGFAEVDVACRVLNEITSQLGLKVDHRVVCQNLIANNCA